jgi:hypothetical protein
VVDLLRRLEGARDEMACRAEQFGTHVEAEYNMDVYAQRMDRILKSVAPSAPA